MKSLAVFEIDGVLDCSSRAVAVAKQAFRSLDWEIAFITSRPVSRAHETLAFLADRLKASKYPKTASTFWCGAVTAQATVAKKSQMFQSLIRQHYDIERVVVYDNDEISLNEYNTFIRSRNHPRSFSLYRIVDGYPVAVHGSAVHVRREPSEF
jgi:hypothetical protein